MEYKYIYRLYGYRNLRWVVRLLKEKKESVCKTFSDEIYGSKEKSLKAAKLWRDKKIKTYPEETQLKLRNGYPRFIKGKGVFIVKHINNYSSDYYYAYIAKCYNKYTKKILKRSFSFGIGRTKRDAHLLAIKWREKTVREIEAQAKTKGYKRL